MLLTYENEITILYCGECRNTYFEIKRSGGYDEQNSVPPKPFLRRNPIEDGAISGFSGQKSVPE